MENGQFAMGQIAREMLEQWDFTGIILTSNINHHYLDLHNPPKPMTAEKGQQTNRHMKCSVLEMHTN